MKKPGPRLARSNSTGLCVRRNIAEIIDLLVCVGGVFALFWTIKLLNLAGDDQMVSFFCIIAMLIVHTCKDLLRPSIGNRIVSLTIVSVNGSPFVPARKLLMRNLIFGLSSLDIVAVGGSFGTQRSADRQLGIAVVDARFRR